MRLIFIPGFGETPHIFDRIAPHLPGGKLFIHNLDMLGSQPAPAITVGAYAQQLIHQHQISPTDVIIGHSMGGWIAYAIKQAVGCPIVQIASWTDPKKVFFPIKNPAPIFWMIRRGWYFNRFTKKILLRFNYRNQPSAFIFSEVFQQLIDSSPEYIINQLRIILSPLDGAADRQPDLRIHSIKDSIVRFPDQSVVTVTGDHFNLFTYPDEIIAVIKAFLASIQVSTNLNRV